MLPLFLALTLSLSAFAHPLCPYDDKASRKAMAPGARAELEGLAEVFADFKQRFGACLRIVDGARFVFAGGEIPYRATKDAKGRLTGLSFGPAEFPNDTLANLKQDAQKAGAALYARREKSAAFSVGGEELREVGEAAHLIFLADYRRLIAEGKLKTSSLAETKPVPAGLLTLGPLLSWPAGIPLTLESAALLSFRSRDNLAADLILNAIGDTAGGRAAQPYAVLAQESATLATGWRYSLKEICEAALSLKNDPAFPAGEEAAEGRERFYDFQGDFQTYTLVHLSQPDLKAPWVCAAVAFSGPRAPGATRARDFLDRAYDLREKF